ncbi:MULTISPECIES: MerR family transcriptional regulator [Bacillus]|uniref:DNA-binding transcriptional MerR regulator n=1 Tax=Bacillus capparidis TaxID=1840411 RepID=A0ABS4CXX6_9BACI|nr:MULTISPECIES: MerR family transcriptional regulator [Bacillus]MBP1082218.1 DNA-binding transcriptional MerR regulator [Bacillus capparidis]MED1096831.1 MerR family transcriptional regulator [Bacillus capparidis]
MARQTGVSARSLRYYEKKKLLIPKRTENGYRQYSQDDIERIQLIKFYLGLGMGTNDIANLIHLPESESPDHFQCAYEAVKLYESKLTDVQQQIEVLKGQEKQLLETLSCWKEIQDRLNQGIPLERKEA